MTAPLIPTEAFAPLRAMAEASLTDEVTLETRVETRQPGGRILVTWVVDDPQPGKLAPASAGGQNIRADQPSAAGDWMLILKTGSAVAAGQRALVRGETAGLAWQRLVNVTRVLHPKPNEIRRRSLCTDTEINP